MDPSRLADALARIGPRRACSDGERRAAKLLARELRGLGRRPRTETRWVRPQWPAVWLLHAVLGIAASVVSVGAPAVALGIAGAAAVSALAELSGRVPALSLLWPRRATQNVVSAGPGTARVRLIVTAAYDAPRVRAGFAAPLARADAALGRLTRGWWPAPLALLTLALVAIAGCAGARLAGVDAPWLGAVQLVPTVGCIVATAVLAELALAPAVDAPNPAASAPAAALALVAALDERPPRRLEVDVVLAGAGDARAAGLRRYVAERRRAVDPAALAVLHLEPCGAGAPAAWRRAGALVSLSLHPQLVAAAADAGFPALAARGPAAALAARQAAWPAVAVGRLDAAGRVPGEPDPAALQDTVDRCVDLVRRLDAALAGRPS